MHGLLFKDIHFVPGEILATQANDLLKCNNVIKAALLI